MTAKEKAKELVYKYHDDTISKMLIIQGNPFDFAKQCVLIAVDEIMKQCFDYRDIDLQASYDYWKEVKSELEKL
jgi:hypothetical protein